jgi:hypothetical protein
MAKGEEWDRYVSNSSTAPSAKKKDSAIHGQCLNHPLPGFLQLQWLLKARKKIKVRISDKLQREKPQGKKVAGWHAKQLGPQLLPLTAY